MPSSPDIFEPSIKPTTSLLAPGAEPIPGYRILSYLGRGGFGEVWKCEAPGGFFKAIKLVYGDLEALDGEGDQAEQELKALERVKGLRHPFLLSMDRLEIVDGRLLIVSELADRNLADVVAGFREQDKPGIPRKKLLAYMAEAAEVLDWMSLEHGLQHLDIKPNNLFLVSNHIKVADFGLVTKVREYQSENSAPPSRVIAATPRYAAPEILQGLISPYSDQYSLALVYYELLTGSFPFSGKGAHQLVVQHAQEDPDLALATEIDQAVLARALSKKPQSRFPTCSEFVRALYHKSPGYRPATASDATPTPVPMRAADATGFFSGPGHPLLPGYEFLHSLGRGPLGEVWKVQTADGQPRLARIAFNSSHRLTPDTNALAAMENPGHVGLAPWRVIVQKPDRLTLVANVAATTLYERYQHWRQLGQDGIPRDELLGRLRSVAEAVDAFTDRYRYPHLRLNPRAIHLEKEGVRVLDAGLVQALGPWSDESLFNLNPRYAAPELAQNESDRSADVYALAVLYVEMLTGCLPHRGQSTRHMLLSRLHDFPDVTLLPMAERDLLACALHPDPSRRPSRCADWIAKLESIHQPRTQEVHIVLPPLAAFINLDCESQEAPAKAPEPDPRQFVADLVARAGLLEVRPSPEVRCQLFPGEMLVYRCGAQIVPELARIKIAGFLQQWGGRVLSSRNGLTVLEVKMNGNWWQSLVGKTTGMKVELKVHRPPTKAAQLTEIDLRIRPVGCTRKQAEVLLGKIGPRIVQSLREFILAAPEHRNNERIEFPHPVRIIPVLADHSLGQALECQGKDISASGMGLVCSQRFPTPEIYIHPVAPDTPKPGAILAHIIRAQDRRDGQIEVGAQFDLPESPKA